MNYITLVIGILAFVYGVFSIFIRMKNPSKFAKLDAMKKFWGEKAGTAIHFIGYTVVPIIVGIVFIVLGLQGKSIF